MSKNKTKKTTIKRARKLQLGDVIEFAGVKYHVRELQAYPAVNNVSITARDIDAPSNLCHKHARENDVYIVLNKDRRIPVLK